MKNISRKNCLVGAIGFLVAAACSGGAAILYAKTPQPGLAAVWVSIAMVDVVMAVFLLKRSQERL
jgi:predicted signal transduction protein with EAL and GGDEF domain